MRRDIIEELIASVESIGTMAETERELDFHLPAALEATAPPEARGLARDGVRLMVSHHADDRIFHGIFSALPDHLRAGDLLVINTSGTINAAIPGEHDGERIEIHLSTRLPGGLRTVELRKLTAEGTLPCLDARAGTTFALDGGGSMTIHAPYRSTRAPRSAKRGGGGDGAAGNGGGVRLWIATFDVEGSVEEHFSRHGHPIRYGYVREEWPLEFYQTAYATEPGSAEMPSAGRAFTAEMITRLVARGVQVAPILLHTGVASLERDEPPYEEYFRVSEETARAVNATRRNGGRVIAVGTTAVRAVESTTDRGGTVHPGEGWTDLVIGAGRGLRAVDGLLTGFHEPRASHLLMLGELAGIRHLRLAYGAALRERYLWHEFGDLHLLLP